MAAIGSYLLWSAGAAIPLLRLDLDISRTLAGTHNIAVGISATLGARLTVPLINKFGRDWVVRTMLVVMFVGVIALVTAPTILITVPAVFLTLFFGSLIAFVVSRYSFKWNVSLLLLFTAGNLLPAQLVFIPVFKMYVTLGKAVGMPRLLYDSPWGVVLIHVAFQMGFATFVLSSYMKTVPKEISESAMVDGASVFTHYTKVMLPLLRPALASLGVLMTTWIYNDFFWALVLMSSDSKRPITSALGRLQGEFVTDYNLLAAGATIAALPTLIVFFLLRKQFVSGLTLGSTKG